ncbi:hypothetical protein [Chryseobacterium sp. SL1]|uniref:hypothetical protein n=1 Tax=Chryseobacterium sp. SL1 TaxID=2995159 RepID=UPI00227258BC|nr:hypothetical protein [Chryseobacterium sp. SL1]MCY1659682.1 hypothetical protein [Chryseobacterium sp. SL1]
MKKSYFIMLMALAFLLQGCRSGDLAEIQDNPTETQHSSKNYASLDKFLQVTGIRKDDLYKDLSFSKETSSDEEFEVNTNKILETIKNQQVTAFSFIVYPKNGSTVEQQNNKDVFYNMAYLKKGNHWEKYILKYTVEKGWLSSLDTQPNKPFNGSITMIYPNAAASKTYVCGFSAVPVFYCWAGHTDPNDDDCGSCWHWNTTSILCDDGSTANPNPDDGTGNGGASGFETNLPTEEYEAMMVQKFASFINNFNLNSYGFSTELKSKLFHLYLSLQEDDYIIGQLLSASPTNSPQKANLLNWAIDYFNENLSTMPVNELTTSTKSFLTWGSNFFIQNPQFNSHFSMHPEDLEKIKLKGVNYTKADQVEMANKLTPIFVELIIAEQNNTISQVNVQNPIWKFAKDYMIYLIKSNAPKAVEYGRIIYEHSNKYFKTHPNSLQKVNDFIDFMKAGVLAEVPIVTNPHYMKWTDVLVCWLFEIGDFPVNDSAGYGNLPTIGFAGADYTISGDPSSIIPMRYLSAHRIKNGIPDENSVLGIKKKAIDNIKLGNYESIQGNWVFGSDATVDTIVKLDGMQFCIGSYQPIVYITPLGGNQYKLMFIIKNKTGWTSGTRGLNDYNGDPTDDSIITDQPRGTGVHLGGTIAETFGWYEIITVN